MSTKDQERYMFVAVLDSGGMQQKPYNVLDYEAIRTHIERNIGKDTYITPNEFKLPTSRTKDNVGTLKEIFIDIDDHMSGGFTQQSAEEIVEQLQDHFNKEIPTPSKVIFSGRGLHYYISLTNETDVAKYELVAKRIATVIDDYVGRYKVLGHAEIHTDKAAIGANRLIRAEGTYNTKANASTTRIYNSSAQYSLNDLIDNFIPALHEISTGTKSATEALNEATGRVYKPYRKEYTLTTWLYAAIDDLKTIQSHRNDNVRLTNGAYKVGNVGARNVMLFYFGLLCKKAYNNTLEVYESMVAFNKHYTHLLDDLEVETVYKHVIVYNYKAPRAQTMIDKLNILPEEQRALRTLISKPEVQRRKRLSDSRYKAARTAQRAKQKDSVMLQARTLHLAGYSYKAIAQSLNISVGSAFNYCK
jgi:hypothetical protein